MLEPDSEAPKIINLGGGLENSLSLKELSNWCEDRFGQKEVLSSNDRRSMDALDVMNSTIAQNAWNWSVKTKIEHILEEVAQHAEKNPNWLKLVN